MEDREFFFSFNTFSTKIFPFCILGVVFISMVFNLVVWIQEVRAGKVIKKGKLIKELLFPKQMAARSSLQKNIF